MLRLFSILAVVSYSLHISRCTTSDNSDQSSSSDSDDFEVFTLERFNQFKEDVLTLIDCNVTLLGSNPCQGINRDHPDMSIYDRLGGNADAAVATAFIRLSFHDCTENVVEAVADGDEGFRDSEENGYLGGCNGCLGVDNDQNDNLLEGAVEVIEPVCDEYSDVISRADCWALAATISVEYVASRFLPQIRVPPFFTTITESVVEGDIPYYYGRKDCENGYADGEVDYPFSNPSGVTFQLPNANLGWTHMQEYFKGHLGWNDGDSSDESSTNEYFNNRDIVGIISGAHSIGRAHERITGYSGPWDFTNEIMDNSWISTLFAEEAVSNFVFGINLNWNQSIVNAPQPGSLPQWTLLMPPSVIFAFRLTDPNIFDPPYTRLLLTLNTDLSLVYDISYFIENGNELDIECVTNAASLCPAGEVILTAPRGFTNSLFNKGKTSAELGEQTECGALEQCCEYIQCPIQCEGGINAYNTFVSDLDYLQNTEDETFLNSLIDCPAALARRYSGRNNFDVTLPNRNMGKDFAVAYEKMITLGYVDDDGTRLLNVVGA